MHAKKKVVANQHVNSYTYAHMEITDAILSIPQGAEFFRVRLQALRGAHDMERWELANKAGVRESSIRRWECTESMPTLCDDLKRIAAVLETSVVWLCWGEICTADLPGIAVQQDQDLQVAGTTT